MSWRKISMKFAGKCTVCKKEIPVGDVVMWAKGEGVKHEACAGAAQSAAPAREIPCMVCGKGAGCPTCEYRDECDFARISPLCICPKCAEDGGHTAYVSAANAKFSILSPSKKIRQGTLV